MPDIERKINIKAGDDSGIKLLDRSQDALIRQKTGVERLAEIERRESARFEQMLRIRLNGEEQIAREIQRETALIEQNTRERQRSAATSRQRGATEAFGQTSAASDALSELLSRVDLPGGAQVAGLAGDITNVFRHLPRLGEGIDALGQSALRSSGLIGTMANAGANLAGAIPGASASLGALAGAVGPLALAAGGAVLAVQLLTAAMDEQKRRGEEDAQFVADLAEAQFKAQRMLVQGDISGLEARRDALNEEIELRNAQIAALIPIARPGETPLAGITNAMSGARADIEELEKKLAGLQTDFYAVSQALEDPLAEGLRFAQQMASGAGDAINAAAAETAKFNQSLTASVSALGQLIEQERQLTDSYVQARQDRIDDRTLALDRGAEDRAISEQDAADDLQRSLERQFEAHKTHMAQIEDAGNQRIADLRQSLIDLQVQAAERVTEIQRDTNAALSALEDGFRQDGLRRLEDYETRKRDLETGSRENVLKAIRDGRYGAARDLVDERNQRLAQDARDFTREEQRRREDFEQRRREIQQAADERIAQTQRELAAAIQVTNEKIAGEQRALQAALKAAEDELNARLALDAEDRRIRAERDERDRARRAAREEEDFNRAEDRNRRGFEAQIRRLDDLQTAEQDRIDVARNGLLELQALERQRAGTTTPAQALPIPRFAGGGIVRQPTLGLLGDGREPEMVLPLSVARSSALPGLMNQFLNLGGGDRSGFAPASNAVYVNTAGMFNGATFGAPTHGDVESMVAYAQREMAGALRSAVSRLVGGTRA